MQDAPPQIIITAPAIPLEDAEGRRNEPTILVPAIRKNCAPALSDEIVVCAHHDNERYRLRPLPPPLSEKEDETVKRGKVYFGAPPKGKGVGIGIVIPF